MPSGHVHNDTIHIIESWFIIVQP